MKQKINLVSSDDGVIASILWDGTHITFHPITESGKALCEHIEHETIGPPKGPIYTVADGKPFFDELPRRYRSHGLYATIPRDEA